MNADTLKQIAISAVAAIIAAVIVEKFVKKGQP